MLDQNHFRLLRVWHARASSPGPINLRSLAVASPLMTCRRSLFRSLSRARALSLRHLLIVNKLISLSLSLSRSLALSLARSLSLDVLILMIAVNLSLSLSLSAFTFSLFLSLSLSLCALNVSLCVRIRVCTSYVCVQHPPALTYTEEI